MFSTLHTWVRNNRLDFLENYFDVRLADDQLSESSRKLLTSQRTYLRRHWEAIQSQKDDHYISCSAEGHVSHYLSARLSSRPMGWSNTGADHMAKLRMYILNNGSLTALIENKVKKRRKERKIQQLDRRVSSKHRQAYCVIQGKFPILEYSTDTMLRRGFSGFKGV